MRLIGQLAAWLVRALTPLLAWAVTGASARWQGCLPDPRQRIYFANHASHGDFILIWSALPEPLRRRTRPVVGADYWGTGRLRPFIGHEVFNAVPVVRGAQGMDHSWMDGLSAALGDGASLILFPEGTRNTGNDILLPFKAGLYHLARAHPGVELVPVWIENARRVLPKGDVLPVPLLCSVTFGEPVAVGDDETKAAFLDRAQDTVLTLAPRGTQSDAP